MTTEYKLNTLIEWTAEDRAKGMCPVPDGSDVTVWLSDGRICRAKTPDGWGKGITYIIAYLIHSVPREPMVAWGIVGGTANGYCYASKDRAEREVSLGGGRIVKMVEEME